ncbi:MAG TPA: metalloregulator ArsR/SmtB family transcription factor [bacterium]|nr:metalloregulator ArsR/SmtB family transcription factor [bacterium]
MKNLAKTAETLKLLGNQTRLRILCQLLAGACCVKDISDGLSLPQATVSQHLALLRNNEIVTATRQGAQVCYSLTDPKTKNILSALHAETRARRPRCAK